MQSKNISLALRDLIRSGKTDTNPVYGGPQFNTVDIFPIFRHSFSEKALRSLDNKANSIIYQYNKTLLTPGLGKLLSKLNLKTCKDMEHGFYVRRYDKVECIASRAIKDKLHQAVEKVINTVNHLADKDFTRASLTPLSVLETHPVSRSEPEYIVLSYITLTERGVQYTMQNLAKMFAPEGSIVTAVEEQ